MKCANCGNNNKQSLFDEGDSIYCSECTHRTLKLTNKDDSIICPVCHHPRDRKAMYCRWCNDSSREKYDSQEEKLNKEYQDKITEDNKNFRKYKNFDGKSKKRKSHSDEYEYQNNFSDCSYDTNDSSEDMAYAIGAIATLGILALGIGKEVYKRIKTHKNTKRKEKTRF